MRIKMKLSISDTHVMEYKTHKQNASFTLCCLLSPNKQISHWCEHNLSIQTKLTNHKVNFMQHLTAGESIECLKLFRKS